MFPAIQTENATKKERTQPTPYTEQYSVVDGVCQVFNEDFVQKKVKKSRRKKTVISPERNYEIYQADKYEQFCTSNFERHPLDASSDYYQKHPTVWAKSNRFWRYVEQNRDSYAGFHSGTQPFQRIFDRWFDPYFYTLALEDLPVTPDIEKMIRREQIFNPRVDLAAPGQVYRNSKILAALLREHLDGYCLWKIESNLEVPHIHAVAERDAGLLHLPRLEPKQKGKCSPVYDPQGLMTYLLKPVFHIDTERLFDPDEAIIKLALVIKAKRDFRQPHPEILTAYRNSPGAKTKTPKWVEDRARPYANLPNMRDVFGAKSAAFG